MNDGYVVGFIALERRVCHATFTEENERKAQQELQAFDVKLGPKDEASLFSHALAVVRLCFDQYKELYSKPLEGPGKRIDTLDDLTRTKAGFFAAKLFDPIFIKEQQPLRAGLELLAPQKGRPQLHRGDQKRDTILDGAGKPRL
jgi:hypothetical protein